MNGSEGPQLAAHDAAPAPGSLPPAPLPKLQQADYAWASGAAAAFATVSAICWLGLRSERSLRMPSAAPQQQPHGARWEGTPPWQRVVAAHDEARRLSTLAGGAPHAHAAATAAAEQAAPRLQPKVIYRPGSFPQRVGVVLAAVGLCTVATTAVTAYVKSLPNHEVRAIVWDADAGAWVMW